MFETCIHARSQTVSMLVIDPMRHKFRSDFYNPQIRLIYPYFRVKNHQKHIIIDKRVVCLLFELLEMILF